MRERKRVGESEALFNHSLIPIKRSQTHTHINNQCAAERNNKQNIQKTKENKTILKHYNYTALSAIYYLFIYDFARVRIKRKRFLKFEVKDDLKKKTNQQQINPKLEQKMQSKTMES